MTVYVDNYYADFGRMKMCHMVADSTEELNAMADKIGVARRWIQDPGDIHEHYDVSKGKRALAVAAGAVEVEAHQLGGMLLNKRKTGELGKPEPIEESEEEGLMQIIADIPPEQLGFWATTPNGQTIHVTGDPKMSEETLAALGRMADRAFEQFKGDSE